MTRSLGYYWKRGRCGKDGENRVAQTRKMADAMKTVIRFKGVQWLHEDYMKQC